jgi:pantetheine-phosphate adenylyltransferase
MTTAIYPGTFDPFTLGHVDLIERAAKLYDKVIVAIANSPQKLPLFSLEERLQLGQTLFAQLPNVQLAGFDSLLVDFVRQHKAQVVIRGIRTIGDFDFELQLARMNRHLLPGLETIFLLPGEQYTHISATLVREIASLHGDVSTLVPAVVKTALKTKFK